MPYTQKYCLVAFTQPTTIGTEFNMADWPLHVTLADVFAINLHGTAIETKLTELLRNQPYVKTTAMKDTVLGTAEVVLLDKNDGLITLHAHLIDLLEKNDATFNTPEFTGAGFVPHCTVQKTGRIHIGDEVNIGTIALVDMFPSGDWQQRKIIKTFELQAE